MNKPNTMPTQYAWTVLWMAHDNANRNRHIVRGVIVCHRMPTDDECQRVLRAACPPTTDQAELTTINRGPIVYLSVPPTDF